MIDIKNIEEIRELWKKGITRMYRKVINLRGSNVSINVPAVWRDRTNLKIGDYVEIVIYDDFMIVKKVDKEMRDKL